jgi:hypothetical protein
MIEMNNEENVNGEQQGNTDAPEVKNEQVNENVETETPAEAEAPVEQPVHPQIEQPAVKLDPDEKILNDMFESGKTEVSTNDLRVADFDMLRAADYSFTIGQFKLSRLTRVEPYLLEKIEK